MSIDKSAVLEADFPEYATLMEADFFESLHRCSIVFVNMGMNPHCIRIA